MLVFGSRWLCSVSITSENFEFRKYKTYLQSDNQFHNILSLFDVLPNFPFNTSETMGDYYL